jgi:hypothetical protein
MAEPRRILQGETVEWTRTLSVYPSGDGWTVKFIARGPLNGQAFEITATADATGTVWTFETTPETTQNVPPGALSWQIQATKTSKKAQIATGKLWIDADLASTGAPFDDRTQAKKDLDAVRSAIRELIDTGKCTQEYAIQIGGSTRSVKKFSLAELQEREKFLLNQVNGETRLRRDGTVNHPVRPVRTRFKRL